LLARTAGLPDFPRLDAHLADTQGRVRAVFERMLRSPSAPSERD
jgi:hypothetical protein